MPNNTVLAAAIGLPNLNRRSALSKFGLGIAAGAAVATAPASAAAAETTRLPELMRLIEAHRAAVETKRKALAHEEELQKPYASWVFHHMLEVNGVLIEGENLDQCRRHLRSCLNYRHRHFDDLKKTASPRLRKRVEAALDAVVEERLSLLEKTFAERAIEKEACGLAAAERAVKAASAAHDDALAALCAYRCATIRCVQIKLDYLSTIVDGLDRERMQALLRASARAEA